MAEVVWFSFRVLPSPMLFTAFPSRQGTAVARFFAGLSGVGLNQNNVTDTVVFRSLFDLGGAAPQYPGDVCRGAFATPNPDDLGRGSKQDASLGKIGVL